MTKACLANSSAIIETQSLQAGENEITMKRVQCPGIKAPSKRSDTAVPVAERAEPVTRPASDCTDPDICVCGDDCAFEAIYICRISHS